MATDPTHPAVTTANNTAAHRYEIFSDGQQAGQAEYNVLTDALLFTHTEILPTFESQGLGSRLARYALDDVRAQGKRVVPVCKFIAAFIHKHPEYLDLVHEDHRKAFNI